MDSPVTHEDFVKVMEEVIKSAPKPNPEWTLYVYCKDEESYNKFAAQFHELMVEAVKKDNHNG